MKDNNKKTNSNNRWSTVMESVEQSIKDMEGLVDITETMRRFNKLKYEAPRNTRRKVS
jgi:hypothetical protein